MSDFIERFMAKVDRSGCCWEWTAMMSTRGYGRIKINGRRVSAHRVSWTIHNGPIPEGLWVLHRCDNRRCVNPEHLFLGTHEENMRDMREKGRASSGEARYNAKLTESDVAEIRRLRAEGSRLRPLAERFGVTVQVVSSIALGRKWRSHEVSNGADRIRALAKGRE